MHNNDKQMLEMWYDELVKRLCTTHSPSHSPEVARLVDETRAIGAVLDKRLPVWDFNRLVRRKGK